MIGFGPALRMLTDAPPKQFMGEVIPQRACAICDTPSSSAAEYAALGGRPVCTDCAEVVSNYFYKRCSGQFLTWPNQEYSKRGFQKKDIPDPLRWLVFERDDFRCRGCGSRRQLRADHIVAESKGGETTLENLQTLCHRCNSKKGNRPS